MQSDNPHCRPFDDLLQPQGQLRTLKRRQVPPGKLVPDDPDLGRIPVGQADLPHVERDVVLLADVVAVVAVQNEAFLGPDRQRVAASVGQDVGLQLLALFVGQWRDQAGQFLVNLDFGYGKHWGLLSVSTVPTIRPEKVRTKLLISRPP